jgi:hypothetical protein
MTREQLATWIGDAIREKADRDFQAGRPSAGVVVILTTQWAVNIEAPTARGGKARECLALDFRRPR